jgi:zinc and cadmium transporter
MDRLLVPAALGALITLASVAAVLLSAGAVIALRARHRAPLPPLLAFAAGTLLGAALLGLLPEAAERLPMAAVGWATLLAIVAFLLLERWVLWRHSHDVRPVAASETGPAGYLILVGDGVHNLVDGLILGAALLTEPSLGWMVAVAVLAHEIPQELGDFVVLLESGLSAPRALTYNVLAALTVFPGVVLGALLAETLLPALGAMLAAAAGGFLYVALADLVPDLHRRQGRGPDRRWRLVLRDQLAPLAAGVLLTWGAGRLAL